MSTRSKRTRTPTTKPPLTAKLLGSLSQRELAKKTGLHNSYISLVLRGKRRPSIDALDRMARALKLSMGAMYAKLIDLEAERELGRKRQKKGR